MSEKPPGGKLMNETHFISPEENIFKAQEASPEQVVEARLKAEEQPITADEIVNVEVARFSHEAQNEQVRMQRSPGSVIHYEGKPMEQPQSDEERKLAMDRIRDLEWNALILMNGMKALQAGQTPSPEFQEQIERLEGEAASRVDEAYKDKQADPENFLKARTLQRAQERLKAISEFRTKIIPAPESGA